jgi:hypothetical protein
VISLYKIECKKCYINAKLVKKVKIQNTNFRPKLLYIYTYMYFWWVYNLKTYFVFQHFVTIQFYPVFSESVLHLYLVFRAFQRIENISSLFHQLKNAKNAKNVFFLNSSSKHAKLQQYILNSECAIWNCRCVLKWRVRVLKCSDSDSDSDSDYFY